MKNTAILFLLAALTACTGCESTEPAVETPAVAPVTTATAKFSVGDECILTIPPKGDTYNVVVHEITQVREFVTGNGNETQMSQGYIVLITKELQTEQGTMEFQIGVEVPEFALTRKRAINERGR